MSNIDRVNSELKKAISLVIDNEVHDPRIKDGLVSIIRVECDTDLTLAKVYYSVIGGKFTIKELDNALMQSKGFIKLKMKSLLRLRKLPDLKFIYNDSIQHAIHIDKILKDINK